MFVSPTEPKVFADTLNWVVSSIPETYGVDFLWSSPLGLVGVQRKEFPGDFLASIHDGRLGSEAFGKMAQLEVCVLLLEGRPQWTSDNTLFYSRHRHDKFAPAWTRTQHRNYLQSVQLHGVGVQSSDDKYDTVGFLGDLYTWTQKGRHSVGRERFTPTGDWGHVSSRTYQRHLLMSFPQIGQVLADAILNTIGFPFRLTVTVEELMTVPGIGPVLAEKIVAVFREVKEPQEGGVNV